MTLKNELLRLRNQARDRSTLPALALLVSDASKRGEIDADDASQVYLTYAGNQEMTQSVVVQISKLRQIIKLADGALMRRVHRMWHILPGERPRGMTLYRVMVAVARLALQSRKPVSDRTIKQLITGS